jgi:hypothetical protein
MIQLRFTFALGVLASTLAIAQEPAPPLLLPLPPEAGTFDTAVSVSGTAGGDFVYVRTGMGLQKLVKGSPYSAQAITEFTQTLADGNRIHHTTTAAVARDSEGRSRREESIGSIGALAGSGEAPKTVFIHDPVAGSSYILEPDRLTARQTHEAKNFTFAPGSPKAKALQVEVGGPLVHSSSRGHEAQVKTEDLGVQVMEGLSVQGKRITRTVPAGQAGNDRPLETVTETWYSQELQTMVMSKTTDPRSGQTVYHLTNVSRAEPDPALFQVPADYKVTQGGEMGHREMRVKIKQQEE